MTSGTRSMAVVRAALHEVAPEADLDGLGGDDSLHEALGLDSIDFLNFAEAISERTGVEVPERDFPRLSTLNGAAGYVASALSR